MLLEEGAKIPADADDPMITLPEYYDPIKFRTGQDVFRNNFFTMMVAKLSGLLILLAVPSVLAILKFTKQSGTPCTAFRRYASTILHTCIWYKNPADETSEFFTSLKNVRRKHCVASRRSYEAGISRISQLDMALTQFGFIGFTLLSGKKLGVVTTDEELEGLLHFWRVIGRLLGTEEKYNLCNGSLNECRDLCRRLLEDVLVPHLANKRKDFEEMSTVLLEGLWPIHPFIGRKAFKLFTYNLISSTVTNNNHSLEIDDKSLPFASRLLLHFHTFIHDYLLNISYWWSSIFRYLLNCSMALNVYLTEHCPFLAYWLWGKKQSLYNIYKYNFDEKKS
ncbi:uncharacterized protein [Chelonus insularis]|nr:uncharacterized protein LOC118066625 isoform X2 [Chelonus insularis]